jgi:hypothetical protein
MAYSNMALTMLQLGGVQRIAWQHPSLSLSKFCQKESQQEGLQIQGQLDATGNAGGEPEAAAG